MIFVMLVSLYTSRVVLATLGIEDYGIYNVVGGVVVMFGFLNGAMSASTSRYITFALGKGELGEQLKVFNTSLQIHLIIALYIERRYFLFVTYLIISRYRKAQT